MPTDKELAELFGIDPSLEQRPTLSQQRALVSSGSFQAPYTASQEAFPTIPEMNVQNVLGYNQGIGSKWGNGLAKMGITALSSGAENTIGLFNGIGQMVSNAVDDNPNTSVTEGLWNNATGRSVDAINEWARDAFPTYYTEAQQKMGLESMLPGSGNAINWWSDKFLNGAGYMLGAVGSGMLASGLLRGASNATVKGLLKKELAGAVKDVTTSASLLEKGGLGIVMAHGESSVEARDIKKNTYDSLIAQGVDPVEAEKISSAAGNVGYAINMALVGGTDISMFGKSLLGWRGLKQESKYLATEAGQAVAKTPGKIDGYLPAIEGFGKEFSQEVGQLGTQKGVEDFYLRQHEISSVGDFFDVVGSVVGESIKSLGTNEGWEAGILGGLLGGPAAAIQSKGDTEAEYQRAKIAADVINTGFKNIQNTKENLLQAAVSGKMAEQNLKEGQRDKFYDNKHDEFKAYVKAVEENGGTDVLIQQMESMKQAPIEEVRQFFQIPAQYNFDEQIKTQKINEAIKEIKQIADVHRKIKENYPTAPKPVFDALFDAATALDNTSKRVSELSGELSAMSNGALSFSELEYKNDKEYRDSFNREAKKVIDNVRQINPAGADEIIEKMKALKYLTLERRDKYVKQWEEAVKNPDKIVEQAKTVEEKAKAISETPIAPKPIDTGDVEANRRNKLSNDIIAEEPGLNSEEKLAAAKQKLIDIDNYGVELNKAFPQEAESNKKEEEKLRKLIQDRIKKYEERILELKHSDKSILHGVSRIGSIFNFRFKRDADGKIIGEEWLTPIADLVKIANVKWQDINSKTTLSYEEYNVPGETAGAIKRLADTDMFPEDYPAGIRTGIKVGDKYYSIAMKVDGIQYGWLLDPDRFQFLENGKYVSFNPNSLDHLRMLNSRFVTTDENGQVVPSAEGFEYIREYKNLMNAFDVLRTKISKGEPISLLDIQDYANLIPQNYFFASAPKEATKFLDERAGKFVTEFKGKTFGPLMLDRKNKVFWEYKDGVFTELDKETSGDLLDEFLRNSKVKNSIDALSNDYLAVLGMDGAKNPTVLTLKYAKLQDVQDISQDIISAIKDITENPNKDIKEITKDKGIFVAGNLNKDSFGAPVTLNIEVKSTKGEKPKLVLNVYSTKNSTGIPRADITLNQVSKSYPYIKTEGDTLTLVKGTTESPITNSQELIAAVNVIAENWIRNAKRKADSKLTLSKNDQLVSTLFTKELGETVPLRITSLQQRPETNSQNLAGATIDSELITTLNLRGKDELIETEPAVPLSDFFSEEPIKTEETKPAFTSDDFKGDEIAKEATEQFGDIFGIFEPQKPSATKEGEDTAFKLSEEVGEDRDLIEAIGNLEDILDIQSESNPNGKITIKEFDEINKNIKSKNYSWGRLIGNVIELSKKRGKGVEYHEAFHAIFRVFLNKSEIQQAYKDARKKYGEPKNLDEFRAEHPSRYSLSKSELELLWLEEQMANDYQQHKIGSKNIFQKIFNKIKNLVQSIFNSVSGIDQLFSKIDSGYYKTAQPRTDVIYFPGQAFKLMKDSDGKYLNPSINEKVISKVLSEALVIKLTKGFLEPSDIKEIVSVLNTKFYNARVFKDALLRIKDGEPGVEGDENLAKSKAREIVRIQLALKQPENQELLYETISERIATTGFPVEDIDTSAEEDMPMELAAKDTSQKGGWSGTSAKVREWLSSIRVPSDDFELNLTDAELSNPVHQNFVNPYQLYNALDRALVNTKRENILQRFEIISRTNKNLRAAYSRLVKDVAADLEIPLDNESILTLGFTTLSNSSTFNMFISNFTTMRADRIKPLIDPESNMVKVIRSNINDIQDIQVNEWKGNWFYKNLDNKSTQTKAAIARIISNSTKVMSVFNPIKLQELVKEVKKDFDFLGINLDDGYIKYSLIYEAFKKPELFQESVNSEEVTKLRNELDFFPEVTWFTMEEGSRNRTILQGLEDAIIGGGLYKIVETKESDGADSRLKKIALGNSIFDESVVPTTVRNIEGKIVYLNLKPNYYLYESFLWRDGKRLAAFKEGKLQEEMIADGNYMSDWQFNLYNQAIKYNHWLNAENADVILKNFRMFVAEGLSKTHLDKEFNVEEFRESIEKTYADTDQASTYLIMLSQFSKAIPERVVNNFRITDNKQDFAPFMLVQTEGKNTQYPVLAPVGDFSSGTKLNQKSLDILSDYMKQEFERIQNVKKGLGVKIEKVNISEKDRGYDYFNFKSIKAIDEAGYNELKEEWNKEKAQELIEKDINQKFQDFLSELKKTKLITDENTSTFLPDYFRSVDKVLEDRLFTFFINQYVNSLAFNNLMFGDSAINFKSFLDEVKRMAGPNANGPSLGSDATNVDIIKDIEIDGINTTDAQSYATPDWFLNKYLKGLGKSNKEVDKIIKKVIRGYELTSKEVEILNKNASLVNPKKTAVFNQSIYGKTSTHTLLRSVTSIPIDRKQLDALYDLIDNNQAYEGIQDDINALWRPVSGREELHEQLNDMYSKGIEVRFRQSAIKTQMVLNTPFIVSDNYIREQVVTDGMKDEIVSGVQYTQLISGEQGEGEATIGDAKVSFKELGRQFEALMGIKQSKTYKLFQQLLFPKGNFSEKYIAKLFERSLDRNEQDILLKAFLVSDHTGFKHNINRLTTLKKAENIFNAITNAITFRQKNAGHKLTLVSDAGYGVIRDEEGKVIPVKRLKQGERGTKDRLSYRFDKEKNIWYAEAIISAQLASQLGYVSGKAFEFVGVRIPTQDKHSMINLRVVDVLPAETGNCCILPHEIIRLAGSDFDIDSEFLNGASYYEKNKALGFFGDYYTSEKKYEQAFEEYLEGAKIYDERFNIDYKEGLKANEEYKALKAKILQYRTDIAEFGEFSDEDVNKLTEVSIEALGSDIKDLATKQRVKQALLDKLKIEQATADLVLKGLGYKTTLEEFKEKYTSQVDRNIQHFKKAEFDKIQPLSVGELNNALWEISKYLVMNKGNEKIANTSATRFIADEFRDKYFKTGIFKDPGALKDINSPQSIVKAKWLNSVGEAGVGVPALSNIAFNYLIKGDVRGYTDYVNSEGQRINDINSAFVSIFVDAAKENDPIYLNLTEDNTGAVLNTMQRGMNPERALLLNVQPAMIELINELNADTGQIFKKQGFDTISKAILEKHTGGKQIELSDENLVKAKVAFETNNFEAISKEEYNFIQYAAIENFLADREESELVRNLNPIISLAKGIKPTFAEMAQVDKSIEALGIINSGGKAVSGKPKNDIYKAVLHSPFLTNLVEDYWKFKKDSANLFIVSSNFASNVIKEIKDLVKENKIGNEEFNSKLNLALVAFLQTKKLQFERKGLNVSDILTLDPKVKPLYIEQFEKLQKDAYFGKNRFIKSLKYTTFPFTKGALAGKHLHKISMPSRIRKDAYYQGQMMDSVEELFRNPENVPQKSADLAKDFIKNLLRITTGKDAGLFKNESFSEFVRPNLTQSVDRALNSIVDVLQKDKEYEKEFGLSKEELFKEAVETIARDYSLQDVFKTEDIKRLKLKKTPEGLSGEMNFVPPRFIYNFAYNPITDAQVYEIYKRNTYTVVKDGEKTKFPVTYTKVFFVGHKDINAAAFDLNTWKMINDTKPVVKKKAEENKYEKQIAELYADVIDLPGDIQKQAIELIKSSKITTDEEMGDLINKICNLGK